MTSALVLQEAGPNWSQFRGDRPRTVAEVLSETNTSSPFLLDGLIHSSANLLTGPPKAGKSFLVSEWTIALATGHPWHGQPVLGGPRPVMIMPTDPWGQREYAERFGGRVGDNVALVAPPRPGDQGAWRELAEDALVRGVGLVVLDNLLSYNPTAKINDNGDVGVTLAGLAELGRLDIPYLVVHHSSKSNQSGYIGSTNIGAHFRHLIHLGSNGSMEISGNYVTGFALRLLRDADGRTADIQLAASTPSEPSTSKSPTAKARAASREEKIQLAIPLVLSMEGNATLSDRERARQLMAAIPGVTTESQGRDLLGKVRKRLAETSAAPQGQAHGPEAAGRTG